MSNDCISRQQVLDFFKDDVYVCNEVKNLPSVTPKPKTGHWIDRFGGYKCSECGCLEDVHSNYCPDCGSKMVKPQESEG